ncbi:MAG: AmmeMemoRadiSam system protein B [Hydrogenophilales bacterium]|nr:AmmeMemoRadiSam system protein B [Hydrogenophilales bacterium]
MVTIRPAAVAGMFYPGSAKTLSHDVQAYLDAAQPPVLRPKALIAPHAGYIYSGPIAATAYALLRPLKGTIKRVVLLGPVHRVWVQGLALPGVDFFQTPLGDIPLDRAAIAEIAALPQVEVSLAAHAQEHSLEVHLPFLQSVLGDFQLVPLAVGGATPAQVSEVLERLWGGPETLIVVSSDLSHYLTYPEARDKDRNTLDTLLHLEPRLVGEQACGAHPVNGLLATARRKGLTPHLLDLRNSGDTAGDKNRVVGYAAIAFTEPEQAKAAIPDKGKLLTDMARASIAAKLAGEKVVLPYPDWLKENGATFVTLTQNGQLRGCIGSLEAHRPLGQDLLENARAAAFRDPRFAPLSADELPRTRVEVSILSKAMPMQFNGEADLLRQLRPGVDGILLEHGIHRATFLPQVWEQLPEPRSFMAHLKQKAGLPADFWADDMRISRYTVDKYKEALP